MQSLLDGKTLTLDIGRKALLAVDQTLLPGREEILVIEDEKAVFDAIKQLKVRGAPAIGVAAAAGYAVCASRFDVSSRGEFDRRCGELSAYLASSRPTARNLFWALERMDSVLDSDKTPDVGKIKEKLLLEAKAVEEEDIARCRAIGLNGERFFGDGMRILTHCNAGRLAAVKYGTALAPVYVAAEKGRRVSVYCDETRPLLQGARLTAYELVSAGIDTTVLCDNMAASLMASGGIDACIVGADRIAANHDVANKIGTMPLAVCAKRFGVPFYVAAPSSTFDANCPTGADITIEQRDASEVTEMFFENRTAPAGVKVFNPAFDVTPHELITAIITEERVIELSKT